MGEPTTVGAHVSLVRGTTYKGPLVGRPGPALLGLGSIVPGGGFRSDKFKTYGGECPPELTLYPGDMYVSLKGATKDGDMVGSVARVPEWIDSGRLTQDTVKLCLRNDAPLPKSYLYWLLRTPHYREYCAGHATGSAVVALSRTDFLSYPVPPATPQRLRLVELLELVESKIELNRKMNQTLEEMAQALFLDWLQVADPTVECPPGWASTTLGAECDRQGGDVQTGPFGSQLHASDYTTCGVPSVMPKDLKDDRVSTTSIARVSIEDAERLAQHRVRPGDLLLSRRGDVERRALVTERERGWLCGTGCLRVRLPGHSSQFLYRYFGHPSVRGWIVRHAQGATMPNLNTSILRALPLVFPDPAEEDRLELLLEPLHTRSERNWAEAETLAEVRDTLLPKLISGELRVPDAEKLVENVA